MGALDFLILGLLVGTPRPNECSKASLSLRLTSAILRVLA